MMKIVVFNWFDLKSTELPQWLPIILDDQDGTSSVCPDIDCITGMDN